MKRLLRVLAATLCSAVLVAPFADAQTKVDPKLPAYKKVNGVSGALNSIGSDTMNILMTYWAEGFQKHYTGVKAQIEGKGSSTAPPALIAGTAQFGPMSREMKKQEVDAFERKFGYKPTQIRVAIDGLAVYVHKDNPIKSLSLQQVDAIFSKTRKGGLPADIAKWGDLGLAGDWANRPISLYGRNAASGTYGYFKEHALFGGDFKSAVKEQPGSSTVVQGVGKDRFGIGYSGIGYRTAGVRAVPLSKKAGEPAVDDTDANIYSGKYPLSRYLYLYVNRKPGTPFSPIVKEFLLYVLSKDGQSVVVKDGYLPLPANIAAAEISKMK